MKATRVCLSHLRPVALAVLLALLASAATVSAQSAPMVQRLSPRTVFYVAWGGSASLASAAQKNHVLQLVHDPAVAPIWLAAASKFGQDAQKTAGPAAAFLLEDIVSLLDNPAVFGAAFNPDAIKPSVEGKTASPFSGFLVYDATGKTALIQKWKALSAATTKTPANVTKYDFNGTAVEVTRSDKSTSYSAQAANYFLFSDRKETIEDLITRFRGSDSPTTSVAQSPDYAQMRKYVGNDESLEIFYARVPDMDQWNPSDKSSKSMMQFSKGVHFDRVRLITAALSFDGEATRFRGAALGDTSPGGLFDVAGASNATFQIQPVIQAGPAFSMSRVNLSALYQLLHDAIVANLTPEQGAQVGALEGAAQGYLGMSIGDALKLFTGEFASTSFYSEDGTSEQLFAATIQKPDSVLRILRAVIGSMIVGEDSAGSTTYLDLAYPYTDPQTHLRRRKFYYVAVGPQMIVAAPRKAMLREAMQRANPSAADPPMGVFANPQYTQLRTRLPEKLSGLSGADIAQIPWDKMFENFKKQLGQSTARPNTQTPADWNSLKLDVIPHYLHMSVSGWWKDANGVYFDSYIQ